MTERTGWLQRTDLPAMERGEQIHGHTVHKIDRKRTGYFHRNENLPATGGRCNYTSGEYRRQGIAKALQTRVVEEVRVYGCSCVQITASDMGVLLYTDFGFVKNGNFMQYRF